MYVVGNGMYQTEQSNGGIRRAMLGDDTARSATVRLRAVLTRRPTRSQIMYIPPCSNPIVNIVI